MTPIRSHATVAALLLALMAAGGCSRSGDNATASLGGHGSPGGGASSPAEAGSTTAASQ
jgi:hypothetical protein